jgi:hypothetical protein
VTAAVAINGKRRYLANGKPARADGQAIVPMNVME